MFWYNIKIAFRNLWRFKGYSLITILGLAFSLGVSLLIFRYVHYELTYDRFYPEYENIYHLYDALDNESAIDYTIGEQLKAQLPEIEVQTKTICLPKNSEITYDSNSFLFCRTSTDSNFFKIFGYKILNSISANPFQNPNSIVLTQKLAKQIFKNIDPLGKVITINHSQKLTVSAIMEDARPNSSLYFDALVCAELVENKFSKHCRSVYNSDYSDCIFPFDVYVRLNPNCDKQLLIKKMNPKVWENKGFRTVIGIQPIKDTYLYAATNDNWSKHGNAKMVYLFLVLAIALVVIAAINYINLTTARAVVRAKEIGILKVVGANKYKIVYQSLLESTVSCLIAMNLAFIIYELFLPHFNSIMNTSMDNSFYFEFPNLLYVIAGIITVGIISGLYPGLYLSAFNPAVIVKNSELRSKGNLNFQKVLIVFQFVISITLIATIILLYKQMSFVKHSNLGFNKEQLLSIDVQRLDNKAYVLKQKLLESPSIKDISLSNGKPFKINMRYGNNNSSQWINVITTDADFIKTFNIELLEGRLFNKNEKNQVFLINETALKYMNWESFEGKKFQNREVIGVVKDFHFSSMYNSIEQLGIMFSKEWPNTMNIKIDSHNVASTIDFIKRTWIEIAPDYTFNFQFYDDIVNEQYKDEERLSQVLVFSSCIAVVISCLGIFGLSAFFAARKTKEIGIRRTNGASNTDIIMMLISKFLNLVIIATAIAIPIAYYAGNRWLESFSYKTELSWWIFALAGLTALIVALFTVSWQAWRAANRNPVEALRYE